MANPEPSFFNVDEVGCMDCDVEKIVHGQGFVTLATLTVIEFTPGPDPGTSVLPVLSMPLDLIVYGPVLVGVQLKLHELVPVAVCQLVPSLTETSTLLRPPASEAVPEMVTAWLTGTEAPFVGTEIFETGAIASGADVVKLQL
jgi:hypothetical protein